MSSNNTTEVKKGSAFTVEECYCTICLLLLDDISDRQRSRVRTSESFFAARRYGPRIKDARTFQEVIINRLTNDIRQT